MLSDFFRFLFTGKTKTQVFATSIDPSDPISYDDGFDVDDYNTYVDLDDSYLDEDDSYLDLALAKGNHRHWDEFKICDMDCSLCAKEDAQTASDLSRFIRESRAVPTPAILHALWLDTWVRQGGKIAHVYNHPQRDGLLPRVNSAHGIPIGCGSAGRTYFVLPQLTGQNLDPVVNPYRIPSRKRQGWEYGHSEVMVLTVNSDGTLVASTNQPDTVSSYSDVTAILRTKTHGQILREALRVLRQEFSTDLPGLKDISSEDRLSLTK